MTRIRAVPGTTQHEGLVYRVEVIDLAPDYVGGERVMTRFECEAPSLTKPFIWDRVSAAAATAAGPVIARITHVRGTASGLSDAMLTLKFRRGL